MRASGYARNDDDWYLEPRWAIDTLLDVERFDGISWDPSCGGGNIPRAMQDRGLDCYGTDLVDRGGCDGRTIDFFDIKPEAAANDRVDNIVTNPPYGVIERYVDHALSIATHKVAILTRLAFLEGQARQKRFREWPLARVWISSRRMSMPPGGKGIPAKNGSIAYAWFIFEHGHFGRPRLNWLPIEPLAARKAAPARLEVVS